MIDEKSNSVKHSKFHKLTINSTNYTMCVTSVELVGVLDIDGKAPCVTDDGKTIRLALRKVLYEYTKLKNDSTLFGEIHQQRNYRRVIVVIPNTKEGEDLLKVINSHIGGFLLSSVGRTPGLKEIRLGSNSWRSTHTQKAKGLCTLVEILG